MAAKGGGRPDGGNEDLVGVILDAARGAGVDAAALAREAGMSEGRAGSLLAGEFAPRLHEACIIAALCGRSLDVVSGGFTAFGSDGGDGPGRRGAAAALALVAGARYWQAAIGASMADLRKAGAPTAATLQGWWRGDVRRFPSSLQSIYSAFGAQIVLGPSGQPRPEDAMRASLSSPAAAIAVGTSAAGAEQAVWAARFLPAKVARFLACVEAVARGDDAEGLVDAMLAGVEAGPMLELDPGAAPGERFVGLPARLPGSEAASALSRLFGKADDVTWERADVLAADPEWDAGNLFETLLRAAAAGFRPAD